MRSIRRMGRRVESGASRRRSKDTGSCLAYAKLIDKHSRACQSGLTACRQMSCPRYADMLRTQIVDSVTFMHQDIAQGCKAHKVDLND